MSNATQSREELVRSACAEIAEVFKLKAPAAGNRYAVDDFLSQARDRFSSTSKIGKLARLALSQHRATPSVDELFIGDNGRVFCRRHGGFTFQETGRDLRGPVEKIDAAKSEAYEAESGFVLTCEACGASVAGA